MKVVELLSDESKWTQGVYAKTSSGSTARAVDSDAVCWCIRGALQNCYRHRPEEIEAAAAIGKAIEELFPEYGNGIARFNDNATFARVRQVLELADV